MISSYYENTIYGGLDLMAMGLIGTGAFILATGTWMVIGYFFARDIE